MHAPDAITCTLTGVDDETPLRELMTLFREHPFAEFGVLWDPSRQGQHPRYPAVRTILHLAALKRSDPDGFPPLALHVCGRGVQDAFEESQKGVRGLISQVRDSFGRIQLNLRAGDQTAQDVRRFAEWVAPSIVITQHNETNAGLASALADVSNHAVAHDTSLGRGLPSEQWLPPVPGKMTGYAGGLGPHNLETELPRITAAAGGGPFWIDMESRIRTVDNRLDLEACRTVLQQVADFSATCVPVMKR